MSSALNQLAVAWLTMFIIGSDLFVVSPLLPLIAADYTLAAASAGLSVTVFAVTYALSAPVLGHIADRVGRRQLLIYCLCAFGAANLLTALSVNFTWLLATRFAAGAAAAGVSPTIYALVGSGGPSKQRGTRLAVVVSGLLVSLSFGTPLGLLTAASFDWPIVFCALGVLSLTLAWANSRVWYNTHTAKSVAASTDRLPVSAVAMGLAPTVLWSTALYAMYTYLGEGLSALSYSSEEIAKVILFYGCGAVLGSLIGGRMADRIGADRTSALGLAGLGSCLLVLPLSLHFGVFVNLAFGLASLSGQLFFPAQQIRLANRFPSRRATMLAWNNSALFLGISLGSLIGGEAVSLGGFDIDLLIAAAGAYVGWIANQDARRRRAEVRIASPRQALGAAAS